MTQSTDSHIRSNGIIWEGSSNFFLMYLFWKSLRLVELGLGSSLGRVAGQHTRGPEFQCQHSVNSVANIYNPSTWEVVARVS